MENYDKYQDLLEVSKTAKGTATTKYQSYKESYASAKNALTAGWEKFAQSSNIIKLLTDLTNFTAGIVEWLPEITRWLRRFASIKVGETLGKKLFNSKGFVQGISKLFGNGGVSNFKTAMKALAKTGASAGKGITRFGDKLGLNLLAPGVSGIVHDKGGLGTTVANILAKNPVARALNPKLAEKANQQSNVGIQKLDNAPGISTVVNAIKHGFSSKPNRVTIDGKEYGYNDVGEAVRYGGKTGNVPYRIKNEDLKRQINSMLKSSSKTKAVNAYQDKNGRWHDATTGKFTKAPKGSDTSKIAGKAGAAVAGVAAGVSRGVEIGNAMLQNYDSYRVYNSETGKFESKESSKESAEAQKTSNVIATALLGSQLGGFLGDIIGNAIAVNKDRKSGKRANDELTERGQKQLNGLNSLGSSLSKIESVVKKGFKSVDDYNQAKLEADAALKNLMFADNKATRSALREQLGEGQDINKLFDKMVNGTDKERKQALQDLEIAQAKAKADATRDSKQAELFKLGEQRNNVYSNLRSKKNEAGTKAASTAAGVGLGMLGGAGAGALAGLLIGGPWGALFGAIGGAIAGGIIGGVAGYNSEWIQVQEEVNADLTKVADELEANSTDPEASQRIIDDKQDEYRTKISEAETKLTEINTKIASGDVSDEQLKELEEQRKLQENTIELDEAMLNYLDEAESSLADINAQTKAIYDEINTEYAAAALKSATTSKSTEGIKSEILLSNLTNAQRKRLTQEELIEMLADAAIKNGGMYGYDVRDSAGNVTEDAKRLFLTQLKSDKQLSGLMNGNIYTLNEALNAKEGAVKNTALQTFASALGTTVDNLGNLVEEWGDVKLGDLIASASDTRGKIDTIKGLFTSMASESGLTADNLENIIANFPDLIQYLGSAKDTMSALLKDMGTYSKIYAKQTFTSIANSEGYFDTYDEQLKAIIGDAKYQDLIKSAYGNATTINDIIGLMAQDAETAGIDKETQDAMKSLYNQLFDIEVDNNLTKDVLEPVIEYQTKLYDLQIEGLNQQKDALQNINKQREYENKLIEAKIRLETAQEQKKRVWREGIGWSYEADQTELLAAEENLNSVEQEHLISELEAQVQQLQYEKETLSNMKEIESLQNLQASYDAWAEQMGLTQDTMYATFEEYAATLEDSTQATVEAYEAWLAAANENTLGSYENYEKYVEELKATGETYTGTYEEWIKQLSEEHTTQANILATIKEIYTQIDKINLSDIATETASTAEKSVDQSVESIEKLWGELQLSKNAVTEYLKNNNDDTSTSEYSTLYGNYETALNAYQEKYKNASESNYINSSTTFSDGYDTAEMHKAGTTTSYGFGEENGQVKAKTKVFKIGDKKLVQVGGSPMNPHDQHFQYIQGDIASKDKGQYWDLKQDSNGVYVAGDAHHISKDIFNKNVDQNGYGGNLTNWAKDNPNKVVVGYDGTWEYGYTGDQGEVYKLREAKMGALNIASGKVPSLINELGTEAIITPAGTVTALPSSTGIVPADITKNLWQLGGLAPAIVRAIGGIHSSSPSLSHISNSDSDNLNIGTVNMTVNADGSFDPERFVAELRTRAALSKNSR